MSSTIQVFVSPHADLRIRPMHGGHHSIWHGEFHVDVCNMIDDVIVRDMDKGLLYRFPITQELLPWIINMLKVMDFADQSANSPWLEHNVNVRWSILEMVRRRLDMKAQGTQTEAEGGNVIELSDPLRRNVFSPPDISPAIMHTSAGAVVELLARKIRKDGAECLVV